MKTLRYMFPVLLLLSALLVSCVAEPVSFSDRENEQEVRITINTGTRAEEGPGTPAGDPADRYINSLRILGYRISDGSLAFNKSVSFVGTADENMDSREWDVEVLTGRFNIVFIANEHSDEGTIMQLRAISETTNHYRGYLESVTFSHNAFASDKDIPMVTLKEDVHIKADYQLEDPDQTVNGGSWSVLMERLGVRIDMLLTLESDQTVKEDAELAITKIPKKVYLFKGQYNDSDEETDYTSEEYPYIVPTTTDADGKEVLSWKRIILPESMFEETNNKDKGVELAFEINDNICKATIGFDVDKNTDASERDYTLPRNTYLDITGEVVLATENINLFIEASSWDEKEVNGDILNRTLNVSAIEAMITDNFPARIYFNSNQPDVAFDFPAKNNSGDNVDIRTFLHDPTTTNFSYTYDEVAKTGTGFVDLVRSTQALNGEYRIYLNAGGLKREIKLMVLRTADVAPNTSNDYFYIGTFHRWNETDERRITLPAAGTISISGNWIAAVVQGKDWIRLDTEAFGSNGGRVDGGILVSGTATSGTSSSGTPIRFRVGLTGNHPSGSNAGIDGNAKPRYGLINVYYGPDLNNVHSIWVRQGEAADYLMENDGTRTVARKMSPYNLTASEMSDEVNNIDVGVQGGTWTAYPTQAGAMFQWGNNNSGYATLAYHPGKEFLNWDTSNESNWSWDESAHETCPPGYRRPVGGAVGSVTQSEFGQSLFSDYSSQNLKNCTWGFYADGFFDRNDITISYATQGAELNAVKKGTYEVAYIGCLYYNSENNASIFFPAAAYRGTKLTPMTSCGYYLSSTEASNSSNCYLMQFGFLISNKNTNYANVFINKSYGFSIRCVKE